MKCCQSLLEVFFLVVIMFFSWHLNAASGFAAEAGKEELIFLAQDGQKLRGLVQKPSGGGPFPVVVVIHGSGGMTDDHADLCGYFVKYGFVGVTYARRGFPFGGGLPDRNTRYTDYIFKDITDLNSVIEHLRKFEFVGNASISVIGWSEGGQIAYLAAAQVRGLKAAIGLAGVTDYLDWYEWTSTEYPKFPITRLRSASENVRKVFGCAPEVCKDRYLALSPIHQVDQISCPIMIAHGEKDVQVPVRQAYRFSESLRSSNKRYEIHVYPNESHSPYFFSIPSFYRYSGSGPEAQWLAAQSWTEKSSQDLLDKITIFLKEHLK
jgi:dipeptidyl aminopeptidase/acylaminoacyl peptidase